MNSTRALIIFISLLLVPCTMLAQVRPVVEIVGGDNVPVLKQTITTALESVLLEMNRISKGEGAIVALQGYCVEDAAKVLEQYVKTNKPYTIRRSYAPQMVEREHGRYYDVRSITVKVELGTTDTSPNQNLIFTFDRNGKIVSIRSMLPMYDYQAVIAEGISAVDSLTRGKILDFLERFRMAYNMKDVKYLEQVYSDEALIIVGTVLREKPERDIAPRLLLSAEKVKLVQRTKPEYIAGLKEHAFKSSSFLNVRLDSIRIVQHEKYPYLYGISCEQYWNASYYSDHGFLFLMMDFRDAEAPVIHVRSWQPKAFDDGTCVGLYDFDVVAN